MSTPPLPPVDRHSLYPEPHRVGDWTETPSPRKGTWVVILLGALAVGLVFAGIVDFGLKVGRDKGTDTPTITDPDGTTINALQVSSGMCLVSLPDNGEVARVVAVPCTEPHQAEVVASHQIQGDGWPGRDAVESEMLDHCGAFIQPGFGADAMFRTSDWEDGLRWVAWIPTEQSWGANERSGMCVVYRADGIVGSFVTGTATFVD
jgi:hypothetical protein